MKLLLSTILFLTTLYADDLQRVASLVDGIDALHANYAVCQSDLRDAQEQEKIYKMRITALENQIKRLKHVHLKSIIKEQERIIKTKASAYRVNKDANIYDRINGKVIGKWERRTSFTSNERTQHWIKITGFFVEKVWRSAQKEMWVKVVDADKRAL